MQSYQDLISSMTRWFQLYQQVRINNVKYLKYGICNVDILKRVPALGIIQLWDLPPTGSISGNRKRPSWGVCPKKRRKLQTSHAVTARNRGADVRLLESILIQCSHYVYSILILSKYFLMYIRSWRHATHGLSISTKQPLQGYQNTLSRISVKRQGYRPLINHVNKNGPPFYPPPLLPCEHYVNKAWPPSHQCSREHFFYDKR